MRQSRILSSARATTLALVLGGMFVVGAQAGPAAAQTTPSPSLLNCSTTTYRFLFWPKGHPAVKSQHFPAFRVPHAEVYSGTGKSYSNAQYLGSVNANLAADHSASCVASTTTAQAGGAVPPAKLKTTKKATALSCTVPSSFLLTVPVANGAADINVITATATAATATIMPNGSKLEYDKSLCKPSKAPT
jgi:hypothetical protein